MFQCADKKLKKASGLLHSVPVKSKIWNQVGMDLIGPLPHTPRGNKYIIVCESFYSIGDHFSLFNSDKIDVHFTKETLVASIRHGMGRKLIKISLCADYEVSLTYNSAGVVLDCQMTMSQLMKTNTLPMLLKVEKGCKRSKKLSDFFEGEILISLKQFTPTKIECFSQII